VNGYMKHRDKYKTFDDFMPELVSNVPATVLLLNGNAWLPLAAGVNVGGTGLIIGSLASLIAIMIGKVGLKRFHRYSLPFFVLALPISALVILIW
jgi:Na+/H+ antiporter NhaD/arsenite permease-like protein